MAAPFSLSAKSTQRGNRIAWYFRDKSIWGPGPWIKEPDKVQWVDKFTGFDCLIVRNMFGVLCGYVGVPEGHPYHGKDYEELKLQAHYDVNFSGKCRGNICHIPLPGRPGNIWWFGFDCGHANDVTPEFLKHGLRVLPWQKYRTYRYVRRTCELLTIQILAAEALHG